MEGAIDCLQNATNTHSACLLDLHVPCMGVCMQSQPHAFQAAACKEKNATILVMLVPQDTKTPGLSDLTFCCTTLPVCMVKQHFIVEVRGTMHIQLV